MRIATFIALALTICFLPGCLSGRSASPSAVATEHIPPPTPPRPSGMARTTVVPLVLCADEAVTVDGLLALLISLDMTFRDVRAALNGALPARGLAGDDCLLRSPGRTSWSPPHSGATSMD